MDSIYWPNSQSANRTNVSVHSVANVESNQPSFMPYGGVEIPAASLELFLNQQRLAGTPGISLLPYAGSYASQVLDGAAVPAQMVLPGVVGSSVATAHVQPQAHCDASVIQPVASSYRSAEQSLGGWSAVTIANVLPVSGVVNSDASIKQMPTLKQPLQSMNLSDLLDYSFLLDNGLTDAASTVDIRNPTLIANMLQSLNAASLPPAVDPRVVQASQHADVQQFSAAKPAVQAQGVLPFQEFLSMVNPQNVTLSNQHQSHSVASLYSGHVAPASTVHQSMEPKAAVSNSGVVWPWGNQMLVAEKPQLDGALVHIPACTNLLSSSALPAQHEAVSPPGGNIDNVSFSLLDNLQFTGEAAQGYQLNSLLGSTIDASPLLAGTPQNVSYISHSQQSNTVAWTTGAKSSSYSAPVDSRTQPHVEAAKRFPLPTLESVISRHAVAEQDKAQKPKSNLGIVLPMTHASRDERGNTTSQSSVMCRPAAISRGIGSTSVEQQGLYATNNQLSVEKSAGPLVDGAGGGIVLTNITGNVYVNQYTMLPGGAPPLDNALLHADYTVPSATAGTLSYDAMPDETVQSVMAPSLAVMLTTGGDELHSIAAGPATAVIDSVQRESNPPHAAGSLHQTLQKSLPPESSFFGPEAAPVLAAKPSNKFESSFLQFICGHKAETLSSVLNTPIKTRPVLPKYVPEPRRPRQVEVTVADTDDKMEALAEPSLIAPSTRVHATISSASSLINSETTTTTTTTSVCSNNAEWPLVTKLPAKFSHKWKNRTSLSSTGSGQSTVAVTCQSVSKGIEVISSKSADSYVDVLPSSSSASGKTKNPSTKWTVSKKSKCSHRQDTGLPVLVLKAVPVGSSGRPSSSTSKPSR